MYRLRGMASALRMRFFCSCQLATVVAWHVSLKRSHFWHPIQTVVIWPITFKLATSLAYLFFLRRYQAIVAMATKHTKPTTTARAIKTDLIKQNGFEVFALAEIGSPERNANNPEYLFLNEHHQLVFFLFLISLFS